MDKLKVWLIPGFVALLALGALFYFRGQLPQKTPVPGDETMTVEVETTGPKGFAKPPEPSAQKKAEEDARAMAAAVESGQLSDCAKITWSEEMRKQCEDNLNFAIGIKSADEAQCKKLNDEALRDKCLDKVYLSTAVDQKDRAYCEKIKDPGLKQSCLDQVAALLAQNATSVSDCASINSDLLRKQCEDNFYLKNSSNTLNISGCDNISDPLMAEQCRKTVTKNIEVMQLSKTAAANPTTTQTPKEILETCNRLTGVKATLCKDAIYPQLAFDEKDVSYCSLMSDETKAAACIAQQGEAINTYLLRQAIASGDRTLCDKITDAGLQATCKNS